MANNILRVAIPTPLRRLFDYLSIPQNVFLPQPGMRVRVPFGKLEKIGLIIEVTNFSDCPKDKLKPAIEYLDPEPLLPVSILELILWASRYYQTSLGEVFETAFPARLRKKEVKKPRASLLSPSLNPAETTIPTPKTHSLNLNQQQAVTAITQHIGHFKIFLLEGITGSGKTEVYLHSVEFALQHSKQALILVPEIGLIPQLVDRFQSRFNVPIALLHSGLTEKQRFDAWEMARTGKARIVIGTRSAAFTPLKAPGIFILDEEHDPSYKQQTGFRYHARDLIILRASKEKCPVILGTATPSLETLHNVDIQKFQRLNLPVRAGNAKPPNLQILDVRHKKLEEGLSSELIIHMRKHLANDGQILLFLNRRGFAPVLMCFECGWVANCKQCDAKMTLHFHKQKLVCHHCDSMLSLHKNCPTCNNKQLNPLGIGTERLEATLQHHFPDENIIRLDRDTTYKKGKREEAFQQIKEGQARILLGTQMITKGHHFPNVTLVAILNIDQALFSIDFRSTERLGQLITQVAGRAGRETKLGHVLLQTSHPSNPLIRVLLEKDYSYFAKQLLIERQSALLPPFCFQTLIRAEAKKIENPILFLNTIKNRLLKNSFKSLEILGPTPAPMERRGGQYRAQLLLQSPQRALLHQCLNELIPIIESLPLSKIVRWSLDVDPIDMF